MSDFSLRHKNKLGNGLLFILLLALTISPKLVTGSHLVGGDLTYQWLDTLKYEITLNYYFDCDGNRLAFEAHPEVDYFSSSCSQSGKIFLDTIKKTGNDIAPICDDYTSSCEGGSVKGIEKYIFKDTVTLPERCADWVFSWEQNARNKAITTVSASGREPLYLETHLNNKDFEKNSSPYFTNDPVAFICKNQNYVYNHGAKDPNGDSLVYSLYKPKTDWNENIDYLPGYSYQQPLKSSPPVSIDSFTGNISLNPQKLDVTVIGVKVKEYDTAGQLKGKILRDIQVNIKDCTSPNAPKLAGFTPSNIGYDPAQSTYDTTLCPGRPIELYMGSKDPDQNDSLYMSWNKGIPGANFKVIDDSTNSPVGKFSWTTRNPSSGFNTRRYSFTVNVRDNNCPYYTNIVKGYAIDVIPSKKVDLGDTLYVPCDDSLKLRPSLKGADSNYTINWSTGSNKDSIWVKEPGKYWLTVTDSETCAITDSVIVLPSLNPDYALSSSFSANRGCINDTVKFYDASKSQKSTIISWHWKFGDGDTAKIQNPKHKYSDTGEYDTELIIKDANGCEDTLKKTISIDSKPEADFEVANVCTRKSTLFKDKSQTAKGVVKLNFWQFGDGEADTLKNIHHIYNKTGNYNVRQIAETGGGCRDTFFKKVSVHPSPKTGFTFKDACQNQKTKFIDTSLIENSGEIIGYNWNLSNGHTSKDSITKVQFEKNGKFTANLISTSKKGCEDTMQKSVKIFSKNSKVNVDSDSLFCLGDSIKVNTNVTEELILSFSDNFEEDSLYKWDTVVNGKISDQCGSKEGKALYFTKSEERKAITPKINVTTGGKISFYIKFGTGNGHCDDPEPKDDVSLWYSKDNGISWIKIKQIDESQYPKFSEVNFSIPKGAQTKGTKFKISQPNFNDCKNGNCYDNWAIDEFKIYTKPLLEYNWKPKSGISDMKLKEPYLSPDKKTTYILKMREKNKNCSDKDSLTILPPRKLNSGFISRDESCQNETIKFYDTTKMKSGKIARLKWKLGNNNIRMHEDTFSYSYKKSGQYRVKLLHKSKIGCRDSMVKTVQIMPKPNVNFNFDKVCVGDSTHFENQSTIVGGRTLNNWKWYFGHSDSSTTANPTYAFDTANTYNVTLIATSNSGCRDTVIKEVKVKSKPEALFSFNDSIQCTENNKFQVINKSKKEKALSYKWYFGDGDTSIKSEPAHTYSSYGDYPVKLITTGKNGCKDSLLKTAKVVAQPKPGFTNLRVCHGDSVSLVNQAEIPSGNLEKWHYNFGDNTETTTPNPTHYYKKAGKYQVKQTVTSEYGCKDSITKKLFVYGDPGISNIKNVTVKKDQALRVTWNPIPNPNPGNFILERAKGLKGFEQIGIFKDTTLSYQDQNVNVKDTFYTYRVKIIDSCGKVSGYSDQKGTSVHLSVKEGNGDPKLNWTPYRGWPVDYYQVQLLNTKTNKYKTIQNYDRIPPENHFLTDRQTTNTFQNRCYRIIAKNAIDPKVQSISNTDCLERKMRLYVPNAFSPNGDGYNEKFKVKGTYIVNFNIIILDRWGEIVFESNSIEKPWDGTFKGQQVPSGVYFYTIVAEGPSGQTKKQTGQVNVIR